MVESICKPEGLTCLLIILLKMCIGTRGLAPKVPKIQYLPDSDFLRIYEKKIPYFLYGIVAIATLLQEFHVVSCCANPECLTPLRYLRDGRLFQFEVRSVDRTVFSSEPDHDPLRRPTRHVSHFWLCGHCASNLTLIFDQHRGVVVTPLHTPPPYLSVQPNL